MNKQDRRYKKTDELIKKVFIELAKADKNMITHITVTRICDKADINRGTFYQHYETIPDLIDQLENEYAKKLIEACSVYHYDKDTAIFFDGIFNAVKNYPELFYYYFFISNGKGMELLEAYLDKTMVPMWLQHADIDKVEAGLVMRFQLRGSMGILKEWYLNDFKDEERYRKIFDRIVKHGLYDLVYLDR